MSSLQKKVNSKRLWLNRETLPPVSFNFHLPLGWQVELPLSLFRIRCWRPALHHIWICFGRKWRDPYTNLSEHSQWVQPLRSPKKGLGGCSRFSTCRLEFVTRCDSIVSVPFLLKPHNWFVSVEGKLINLVYVKLIHQNRFHQTSQLKVGLRCDPTFTCRPKLTVDGRHPASQLRLVVYPMIYKVLYIPGGCLGFLPSREGHQHFSQTSSCVF